MRSRCRDANASGLCLHASRKPFPKPPSARDPEKWTSSFRNRTARQIRGRRSAERRIHRSPPRRREKACQRVRRAPSSCPAKGSKRRRARLSALHRGHAPRVLSLDSAPGRASWNHRMQTGGPSPAPVQRAPRSPITRRTGRCPKPLAAQCIAAPARTAPAPSSGIPPEGVPIASEISQHVIYSVTNVKTPSPKTRQSR